MDEENMLQLHQNRYDETDPSSAEAREACFSPQEMRGPADINRVVVPIVDQQDTRRSHATLTRCLQLACNFQSSLDDQSSHCNSFANTTFISLTSLYWRSPAV